MIIKRFLANGVDPAALRVFVADIVRRQPEGPKSRIAMLIEEHGVELRPIAGRDDWAVLLISNLDEPIADIHVSNLDPKRTGGEASLSSGWSTPDGWEPLDDDCDQIETA